MEAGCNAPFVGISMFFSEIYKESHNFFIEIRMKSHNFTILHLLSAVYNRKGNANSY